MYYKTEGVILAQKNFSEADKLLTIYTRDYGKIICIAKSSRRPTSKKTGHIELGNWCKMFIARGRNLDLLQEVQIKRAFGIEKLPFEKANKIYHFLELIDYLAAPHQKNFEIFSLLVNFLKKIDNTDDFLLLSCTFKVKILSIFGFFSANNLKNESLKKFFQILEDEEFEVVENELNLNSKNHLKLLNFLDSMIENITERKLKTTRFISG